MKEDSKSYDKLNFQNNWCEERNNSARFFKKSNRNFFFYNIIKSVRFSMHKSRIKHLSCRKIRKSSKLQQHF